MGLFTAPPPTLDFREIVARYQRFRPVRLRLNNELVHRLSRDALDEGAKKIGMFHNGMFVFENEDETSVLMDYCIYDVHRAGRNAVQHYLRDSPPAPGSDEMECLQAMQRASYALVAVVRVEPGVGCHVRNLFTEETRLLVDMGLSETARPGAVIATRLLDFGGFVATGGAVLPLGILDEDELEQWQRKIRAGADEDHFDPAPLIRACLENGASSHIQYEGADEQRPSATGGRSRAVESSAERRLARSKLRGNKAATNRRCRCGSGKMFKNCCGKR